MTHIAVLGSTTMDLVAYVAKAPQRGETVTGREMPEALAWASASAGLSVQRPGASFSMPYRSEIDTQAAS